MIIPSNRWIWNLNPDIRWNKLPKHSFQTKKRENTQLLYIQMHANQASAITKTGHNNSPDHASTSSTVLQIWHSPWLATKQAMANCGVHQNSRSFKKVPQTVSLFFFSMEAVGMCHVSQVPKELAFVSRKMGAMEKKQKSNYLFIYFKISIEVNKFIQTFTKNFKKSCLSFNFPLCNIWKNHLFILRIALSLFLCQAALMCITLFRTLPTAATRWLASRLTKVWVLAFFFGLMRFDDRWKNFIL